MIYLIPLPFIVVLASFVFANYRLKLNPSVKGLRLLLLVEFVTLASVLQLKSVSAFNVSEGLLTSFAFHVAVTLFITGWLGTSVDFKRTQTKASAEVQSKA